MNGDISAILAAIEAVKVELKSDIAEIKSDIVEIKKDIVEIKKDIKELQKAVSNNEHSLKLVVGVVAGPLPDAINKIEEKLQLKKTDLFANTRN